MAGVKYTDEQRAVIESRQQNLLVSAAAGSGKTAVLTARILSLMTDKEHPVDIDRMLIVSFTRAAAAEMRERIGRAIAEYAASHPEDTRMERQAALLHNAQITTIDSFCLFVVRNNFSDIGLDPGFRIADEGERTLILSDALDNIIKEEYERGDTAFLHLAESCANAVWDSGLNELVLMLFNKAMSLPQPDKWLRECYTDAAPASIEELERSSWYGLLKERGDELAERMLMLSERALSIAEEKGGPAAYVPAAADMCGIARLLCEQQGYGRRQQILAAAELPKLSPGKKKDEDADMRAQAKSLIDEAKVIFSELSEHYAADEDSIARCAPHIGGDLSALVELTLKLKERFEKIKREKGIVDFSDMEHFALRILLKEEGDKLLPTAAAEEYREYFEQIFVDEYQDSNYVQEYILTAIAREDNYFCVGDVKQSIYRFRNARPEIFMDKYERYAESGRDVRIDLNKNFRSRSEVLDFVNSIFKRIMTGPVAGLDYDDKAMLYAGADYYPPAAAGEYESEILTLYTEDAESYSADEDIADDKLSLECRMAAERIQKLMRGGFMVYDKDEGDKRPIRYGDIVLLARSTMAYEQAAREVFAEYDIPLYCAGRSGYFKAPEVRCLLGALKVIDNPRQDMPLHGTLVHFLKLLGEEEMARIRAAAPGAELYDALMSYKDLPGADVAIVNKLKLFSERLSEYRACARYMKVRELMEKLLRESGYLLRVAAEPAGAQRAANIRLLLLRAADYEQSSYKGLFHFIRYIGQLKEQEVDFGEAGLADENADVVRLMTIHKSKGLEFPVVICLGLYRRFNRRDVSAQLLIDAQYGIAMDATDPAQRVKYRGLKKSVLAAKAAQDALAEDMRVLYVALTRAKEKLILTDIQKEKAEEAAEVLDVFRLRRAGSLMALIRMALSAGGELTRYEREFGFVSSEQRAEGELRRAFGDKSRLLDASKPVDPKLYKKIHATQERVYAHPELKGLYTKTSVSELKHAAYEDEEAKPVFETDLKEAYVPAFAREEEGSSGTSRGSAYHRFLELFDYVHDDAKDIKKSLDAMRASGRLSEEYAALIHVDSMKRFFAQDDVGRIYTAAAASLLYREQPFFMGVPASELSESFPADEQVLIQGVIDAYWEEGDGLVLLDYKTDRVTQEEELLRRYSLQLALYARALESIRRLPVKEKLIYSFALNRFIRL